MLKVQDLHELIKSIDQSSIIDFTYEKNESIVSITMKKEMKHKGEGIEKKIVGTENDENEIYEVSNVIPELITDSVSTKDVTEPKSDLLTHEFEIVSPMVGTFYAAPDPDSEVYVKEGSIVNEDTVVCVVEAMKLYHEIEAEVTGEIVELLVENGELVEYGQPLFKVKSNEEM